MSRKSRHASDYTLRLEVEADFDPSILGLGSDDAPTPDAPRTDDRPSIRRIPGTYATVDWSPPRQAFRRTFGIASEDKIGVIDKTSEHAEETTGTQTASILIEKSSSLANAHEGDKTEGTSSVKAHDYAALSAGEPNHEAVHKEQAATPEKPHIADTFLPVKPRIAVRRAIVRRPGRPSRHAIHVLRSRLSPTEGESDSDFFPPVPALPPGPLADLQIAFGGEAVDRLRQLAVSDLHDVRSLPVGIKETLSALSAGPREALGIVNAARSALSLPPVPLPYRRAKGESRTKKQETYRSSLQRAVARMRGDLYTHIMADLALPNAPAPPPAPSAVAGDGDTEHATTDEDTPFVNVSVDDAPRQGKSRVDMTAYNLQTLAAELPVRFPGEKKRIRDWANDMEQRDWTLKTDSDNRRVVWVGGVGRIAALPDRPSAHAPRTRKQKKARADEADNTTTDEDERPHGDHGEDGDVMVFVDHSNILHGLVSLLSHASHSGTSVSKAEQKHLPLAPSSSFTGGRGGLAALGKKHTLTLSLAALHFLLLRGRPPIRLPPQPSPPQPALRSLPPPPSSAMHIVASSPLAQSLDPLVRLGWECSVLKRVEVRTDEVEDPYAINMRPKAVDMDRQASLSADSAGSAGSRGSTAPTARTEARGTGRWKEQGVDEILHLKILQGLNWWDRQERQRHGGGEGAAGRRRTLVLATGDARAGQFSPSGGFLSAVQEALDRGWDVELWSWRDGLGGGWWGLKREYGAASGKDRAKRGRFRIEELDRWVGCLVDVKDDQEDDWAW